MPIPLLFIGIAALSGAVGVGTTAKAGMDQYSAVSLNKTSNNKIEHAGKCLELTRKQCGVALENLGEEKLFILSNNMKDFLDTFTKIKNVDFRETEGLIELKKLHIDKKEFDELSAVTKFSISLMEGGVAGAAGGALTALGAYSLAGSFAVASTGTAISTLGGAAATNATLAFFGGGSLAAGGLGVAGGTAVLGGLVAGPALLVMGIITGAKAGKALEEAKANAAKAEEICHEFMAGTDMCIAIRRRSTMYYCLLAKLDAYFLPLIEKMQEIVNTEGEDYSKYSLESKKSIAACASAAMSIKAVLDTSILSEDSLLTVESEKLLEEMR